MIAWLLAFSVHSTLWLAWLITRARPGMHARVRETLWHTAIAASLIAPTAQTLAPAGSSAWWSLPLPTSWLGLEAEALPVPAVAPAGAPVVYYDLATPPAQLARPIEPAAPAWYESIDPQAVAAAGWGLLSALLFLSYALRLRSLRRRIEPRELVESAPERFALEQLTKRAGLRRVPRLTESENIGSPIAFGLGRSAEICLPTRALHELDHDQFCAMLGHEVAHHMRRDPWRLVALHLLQSIFFFQPLLRVAQRQLHLAAEEQCDAWGASHIEDRLAMARCLTEVASWVMPQDRSLLVAGMARRRSQLGRRVERLMDERCSFNARGGSLRSCGSALVLALAPWMAPSLAPAHEVQDEFVGLDLTQDDPLRLAEFQPLPIEALIGPVPVGASGRLILDPLEQERMLLEEVLALTLAELGPLAFTQEYEQQLLSVLLRIERFRELQGRLHILLAVLYPGEGPSPRNTPDFNTTKP